MSTSTVGGHVNTIPDLQAGPRRRRPTHSDEFKADAVASCLQPGMSMAAVAMSHGVNANLLRRWVREAEMKPSAGPRPGLRPRFDGDRPCIWSPNFDDCLLGRRQVVTVLVAPSPMPSSQHPAGLATPT